ncbi:MAG: PEP-CTERM sorting domain-containing protein [Chitinophagaceae bacterium]|nr:PEP-CTERM sorting domain-containing protein [Rubrivivax sp.]
MHPFSSTAATSVLQRRTLLAAATFVAFGLPAGASHAATSILFIGNSFTYGALASVQTFRPGTVTDLNGTNIGGVPALFKAFTQQAGLDYNVSLETQPGSGLEFHYDNRLPLIDRAWDKVVMHGQSNLDFAAPNNPARLSLYTGLLGNVFQARNPNVDISLTATWARADLTYVTPSPWLGQPISQMALDVQAGYQVAANNNPTIVDRVNPVGLAWNRAMQTGLADPNPYNGITPGQLNLWASDSYHASNYGYYLHALTVFGMVTGIDPRTLGGSESAAVELGFSPSDASALQTIAFEQITAVPEPGTWGTMALGVGLLAWMRRRAKQTG